MSNRCRKDRNKKKINKMDACKNKDNIYIIVIIVLFVLIMVFDYFNKYNVFTPLLVLGDIMILLYARMTMKDSNKIRIMFYIAMFFGVLYTLSMVI